MDLVKLDQATIWHPYTQEQTAPDPILIASGEGAVLRTADGRQILDMISSWWVNLHGHAHPRIAQAIAEQAGKLEQVIFAGYTHEPAIRLAQRLVELLPGDLSRVFYSDNGSTAVEVAMKIAVQYFGNRGEGQRTRFLVFQGGYHGDTVGAMSAGATSGFFNAWKSMLFPVADIPWPGTWLADEQVEQREAASLAALERYLDNYGAETAAMILEPLVQGAGGMNMARPEFFRQVVARLREAGVLVIFDEVMTGFGRTGRLFACDHIAVVPDLVCLSKGITGGFLPLAATVCREDIYRGFLAETYDRAFSHGHSYTANPLGCAAALASLELLLEPATRDAWGRITDKHRERLEELTALPQVQRARLTGTIAALDIVGRGSGYTAGIGGRLKAWFAAHELLIRPLGNVVYLLPPYCTSDEQLDRAWDGVARAIREVAA
ncbi:MAG TPA: adenosylmethionine--8-amino-7-oxononanoate transaminase [Candidatus Competibacteraceae bacterium]|nr:adenosylmethionine--8-amino-7-oxononanoate transaminase [Candidatus Competibacteraceae bacterium]